MFCETGGLAILGNVLVLALFALDRSLRTSTNTLLGMLAVTDLGMALFGFPFAASSSLSER